MASFHRRPEFRKNVSERRDLSRLACEDRRRGCWSMNLFHLREGAWPISQVCGDRNDATFHMVQAQVANSSPDLDVAVIVIRPIDGFEEHIVRLT